MELGSHMGRVGSSRVGSGWGCGPQNAKVAAEIGSLESEIETDSEVGVEAFL